jgi:hypothetical protein
MGILWPMSGMYKDLKHLLSLIMTFSSIYLLVSGLVIVSYLLDLVQDIF